MHRGEELAVSMLVIANPGGGRGKTEKLLPRLESLLKGANADFKVKRTEAPKHATSIAQQERHNFDTMVAFGGDGTVNEIINGLIGGECHLGVIPIGTGNDFARSCGIPMSLEKAVDILLKSETKKIDLGVVNGQYFGNVVGVGFDAYTSKESRKIEKLHGTMVYIWAVFKTLSKYESIPMRIELDDETIEQSTYLVSIGNGWSVGGGMQLTPDAVLDDGIFHVCHIKDISSLKVVRNFPRLMNGNINKVDEVTIYQSRQVRITSEAPLPVHVDGEIPDGEITELQIGMIQGGLSVVGNWVS